MKQLIISFSLGAIVGSIVILLTSGFNTFLVGWLLFNIGLIIGSFIK